MIFRGVYARRSSQESRSCHHLPRSALLLTTSPTSPVGGRTRGSPGGVDPLSTVSPLALLGIRPATGLVRRGRRPRCAPGALARRRVHGVASEGWGQRGWAGHGRSRARAARNRVKASASASGKTRHAVGSEATTPNNADWAQMAGGRRLPNRQGPLRTGPQPSPALHRVATPPGVDHHRVGRLRYHRRREAATPRYPTSRNVTRSQVRLPY